MQIWTTIFVLVGAYVVNAAQNSTFVVTPPPVDNENMYGKCSTKEYMQRYFPCETSYVHALQKNSKCRPTIDRYINCTVRALANCSAGFDENSLRESLTHIYTEKFMCEMGGFGFSYPGNLTLHSVPCSITSDEYIKQGDQCDEKMLKMWKADRNDAGLCRENMNRKQCLKQLMDTKCNFTGQAKETFDLKLATFNPYCPNGMDPTSSASVSAPFGLFIMLVIAALVKIG